MIRPPPCSPLFPYTTLFRSYGEQWIKFMKDGVNATPLPTVNTTGYIDHAAFLGTIYPDTNKIPKHLFQGYLNIYNNYFKAPWMPDRTERSEERFSRNAETDLVCRLLLEKKKTQGLLPPLSCWLLREPWFRDRNWTRTRLAIPGPPGFFHLSFTI